jgi:hypothetical protein
VHGIPPEQIIYNPHSNYYTRLIIKENQKLNQTVVYIIVDLAKKCRQDCQFTFPIKGRTSPWLKGVGRALPADTFRLIGA